MQKLSLKFVIFWHTYCIYCQLGFSSKIEVLQLGSARNLHSSGSLEPENSSSNSSLQHRIMINHIFFLFTLCRFLPLILRWLLTQVTCLSESTVQPIFFSTTCYGKISGQQLWDYWLVRAVQTLINSAKQWWCQPIPVYGELTPIMWQWTKHLTVMEYQSITAVGK